MPDWQLQIFYILCCMHPLSSYITDACSYVPCPECIANIQPTMATDKRWCRLAVKMAESDQEISTSYYSGQLQRLVIFVHFRFVWRRIKYNCNLALSRRVFGINKPYWYITRSLFRGYSSKTVRDSIYNPPLIEDVEVAKHKNTSLTERAKSRQCSLTELRLGDLLT